MVLRMIERDKEAQIVSILEQQIPSTAHAVELYLRRGPFKRMVASAMLAGGTITIETRERA